jgi:PAS domain S-box-containing protein
MQRWMKRVGCDLITMVEARARKTFDDDAERHRLLVESITDCAIYMLDPRGIVTSWNTGAQRLKGYAPEEIIGSNFERFYTEEDRLAGLPRRALEIAAHEGKFESEGWHVRKDGSHFWAHVVIDPIRLPGGRLIGYAKVTRDLTKSKKAEGDVRRSEEQFRRLVQGVTDYAIFTLSPAGIVTNWNIGAQRIKGYAPEEIIGKHFSQFYTEEDRARGEPQVALQTAEREGRFEREAWRVRKDGTRFLSHVVIDAIRDDDGKLIGFAKITRDVTERKNSQEELERAREALFQSQKMDAVGQLTGGVAHDFNNLLMAILASLQMLEKRLPDDPQMKRLLDNAIAGAQRGTSLTQRMLAFARRQQLDTKPIDVRDLVKGMTEFLERSIGSTVAIETHFPLALPEVIGDRNQLELALLNLCVNARDAMPNGGAITIAARANTVESGHQTALPPGHYVCLSVSDSGEGMDAETLARATEPFFTTKGVGKGTGLGLPMVHGMSEQMGGRLLIKSTSGEGTRAEIWLRAAEAKAPSPEPAPIPEPESPKRNLRVLAVDDDALVLFNTVAMLEELGHTALEAHSGAHALEILKTEKVDVVITDQSMPKMTGVQLIEAVKAEWPELPVILATGYAELPGGVEIDAPKLNKPFTERALAAALVTAGV